MVRPKAAVRVLVAKQSRLRLLPRLSEHMVEHVAAVWLNPRWVPFDNAESGLGGRQRHVVGHYRLG